MYATSKLIIPSKIAQNSPYVPKIRICLRPSPSLDTICDMGSALDSDDVVSNTTTNVDISIEHDANKQSGITGFVLNTNPLYQIHNGEQMHPASPQQSRTSRKRKSITVSDHIDLERRDSVLTKISLKSLINQETFEALPTESKRKLVSLLPIYDQVISSSAASAPTGSNKNFYKTKAVPYIHPTALSNEFLSKALQDYSARQLNGEFVPRLNSRSGLRKSVGNRLRYSNPEPNTNDKNVEMVSNLSKTTEMILCEKVCDNTTTSLISLTKKCSTTATDPKIPQTNQVSTRLRKRENDKPELPPLIHDRKKTNMNSNECDSQTDLKMHFTSQSMQNSSLNSKVFPETLDCRNNLDIISNASSSHSVSFSSKIHQQSCHDPLSNCCLKTLSNNTNLISSVPHTSIPVPTSDNDLGVLSQDLLISNHPDCEKLNETLMSLTTPAMPPPRQTKTLASVREKLRAKKQMREYQRINEPFNNLSPPVGSLTPNPGFSHTGNFYSSPYSKFSSVQMPLRTSPIALNKAQSVIRASDIDAVFNTRTEELAQSLHASLPKLSEPKYSNGLNASLKNKPFGTKLIKSSSAITSYSNGIQYSVSAPATPLHDRLLSDHILTTKEEQKVHSPISLTVSPTSNTLLSVFDQYPDILSTLRQARVVLSSTKPSILNSPLNSDTETTQSSSLSTSFSKIESGDKMSTNTSPSSSLSVPNNYGISSANNKEINPLRLAPSSTRHGDTIPTTMSTRPDTSSNCTLINKSLPATVEVNIGNSSTTTRAFFVDKNNLQETLARLQSLNPKATVIQQQFFLIPSTDKSTAFLCRAPTTAPVNSIANFQTNPVDCSGFSPIKNALNPNLFRQLDKQMNNSQTATTLCTSSENILSGNKILNVENNVRTSINAKKSIFSKKSSQFSTSNCIPVTHNIIKGSDLSEHKKQSIPSHNTTSLPLILPATTIRSTSISDYHTQQTKLMPNSPPLPDTSLCGNFGYREILPFPLDPKGTVQNSTTAALGHSLLSLSRPSQSAPNEFRRQEYDQMLVAVKSQPQHTLNSHSSFESNNQYSLSEQSIFLSSNPLQNANIYQQQSQLVHPQPPLSEFTNLPTHSDFQSEENNGAVSCSSSIASPLFANIQQFQQKQQGPNNIS